MTETAIIASVDERTDDTERAVLNDAPIKAIMDTETLELRHRLRSVWTINIKAQRQKDRRRTTAWLNVV